MIGLFLESTIYRYDAGKCPNVEIMIEKTVDANIRGLTGFDYNLPRPTTAMMMMKMKMMVVMVIVMMMLMLICVATTIRNRKQIICND